MDLLSFGLFHKAQLHKLYLSDQTAAHQSMTTGLWGSSALHYQLLRCEHKPRNQRMLLNLVFILWCPTYNCEVHVESLNRSINWRFSHYKSEFTTLGLVTPAFNLFWINPLERNLRFYCSKNAFETLFTLLLTQHLTKNESASRNSKNVFQKTTETGRLVLWYRCSTLRTSNIQQPL